MLFAYFAPEVILPMASVLVAGFGFIMMVGLRPIPVRRAAGELA